MGNPAVSIPIEKGRTLVKVSKQGSLVSGQLTHGGNSMPSLTRLIAIRILAAYLLLSERQLQH